MVRRPRRHVLPQPSGDPAGGRATSPTRAAPARPGCRRSGRGSTSGTTSRRTRGRSVHVLATVDESTYDPGAGRDGRRPPDHLVARLRRRPLLVHGAWATPPESYSEPLFLQLLLGGIVYAAAAPEAPAGPFPPTIASLTTAVRARRVTLTVTLENCSMCTARATVAGRRPVTPLRLAGTVARGTTAPLPTGRWLVVVSVTDKASGLTSRRAGSTRSAERDRERVHRDRPDDRPPDAVDEHLGAGEVAPPTVRVADRDDPDPRRLRRRGSGGGSPCSRLRRAA